MLDQVNNLNTLSEMFYSHLKIVAIKSKQGRATSEKSSFSWILGLPSLKGEVLPKTL